MNESYDPGNYLIAIGLIVFYWHLLRIWHQPPPDHTDEAASEQKSAAKPAEAALEQLPMLSTSVTHQLGLAPAAASGQAITILHEAAEAFDVNAFLSGAAFAYELVLKAYADEDMEVLDSLLDAQASHDFKAAISERRARGEKLALTFVGLKATQLVYFSLDAGLAEVTVRFTGEAVVATYGPDGTVVEGDPEAAVEMIDEWTFARCLGSRNPNWKLVATGGS